MKTILFNIHDIVLIAVLSTCALLAILTLKSQRFKSQSKQILIAFFVMNGFIAVDTLVFWGDGVKYAAFSLSPWLLTLFSFAAFAFGPILYGFIRCELLGKSNIKWHFALHFLPALLTPIYLYWVCYRFPIDIQRELILNLGVYSVPQSYFSIFISLKKLAPVIYGLLCLRLVYKESKRDTSNRVDAQYLLYLTAGFTAVRLWILLTHACGLWISQAYSDAMGIWGNYMTLGLLVGLVYLSFKLQNVGTQQAAKTLVNEEVDGQEEHDRGLQALKTQVEQFMERKKPYLNTQITLERFAKELNLPQRQVSMVINKGFKRNFQEYINSYRIAEAKKLLADPACQGMTVLEVATQSGFNSKASFNRLFKTETKLTPSEYRSNHSQDFNSTSFAH